MLYPKLNYFLNQAVGKIKKKIKRIRKKVKFHIDAGEWKNKDVWERETHKKSFFELYDSYKAISI